MIYALNQGKIEELQIDSFFEQLALKNLGDDTMITIGDYLRKQGKQEGIQQGVKKGVHHATLSIAKNMLNKGLSVDVISETTGLSKEDI